MTINLTPENEHLIAEAMRTGAYENPDDVISCALEMLHSQEQWLLDQKDSIEEKIEPAYGQFERGEFLSPEEFRTNMERRKAKWFNEQKQS
jgi:Arc/MetJ-type ribon-helix-helix transcriptional regulator